MRSNRSLNQERRNLMLHSHLQQHRRTLQHPALIRTGRARSWFCCASCCVRRGGGICTCRSDGSDDCSDWRVLSTHGAGMGSCCVAGRHVAGGTGSLAAWAGFSDGGRHCRQPASFIGGSWADVDQLCHPNRARSSARSVCRKPSAIRARACHRRTSNGGHLDGRAN